MMLDTDILSMLGKVNRADLLRKLFPNTDLAISFEVYNELLRAKEAGYDFVGDILIQRFKVIHLDSNLISEYEHVKNTLTHLHAGELTSILLCKKANVDFVTNDKRAKAYCKDVGVEWLDIVDILRLCYLKHLLDKEEIKYLIRDIEKYDRTRLALTEEIFIDIT